MVELAEHPEGVVLSVRAQPGARQNAVRGEQHGALKVAVTQVAEKGKANDALVAVLADRLGLKRSQVRLLAGPTQAQKKFLITGVSRVQLAERIAAALGGG
jgi:hypothetical protein